MAVDTNLASEPHFETSQYLRAGARAVVSGNDVATKVAEGVLDVDDVVPGWKMPLSEIFDA